MVLRPKAHGIPETGVCRILMFMNCAQSTIHQITLTLYFILDIHMHILHKDPYGLLWPVGPLSVEA